MAKFELLRNWREGRHHPVWNDDQWAMTAAELLDFEAVFAGLDDTPDHINSVMERFTRLVTARAERMLTGALDDFPNAGLFASGAVGVEPEEATAIEPELQTRIAAGLGLHSSGAHTVAEIWYERRDELEWSFKEATKRHTRLTDPAARAPWLWRDTDPSKSGFNYFRELQYATTSGRSKFRVGVSSWLADEGGAFMWLLVPADADEASAINDRIRLSQLEAAARKDDRGVWLPLDLKAFLSWDGLATDIYSQVYEIRKVLENTEKPGSIDPAAVAPGTAVDG
jgi:hypothetical protein